MHILQSWKESVLFFKPSNLKLFFLVSLRACSSAIVTMVTYWWWLILLYWSEWFFWSQDSFYGAGLATNAIRALLLILFLCSLRASSAIKNYPYFARILLKIWYIIPLAIGFFWVGSEIPLIPRVWESIFYFAWSCVIMYIFILFILFAADSDGSFRLAINSAWRAFKIFIYNLPWFLIVAIGFGLIEWVVFFLSFYIAQFSDFGAMISSELLTNLFYSFELALIVNFYIKRLYDQLELYFALP